MRSVSRAYGDNRQRRSRALEDVSGNSQECTNPAPPPDPHPKTPVLRGGIRDLWSCEFLLRFATETGCFLWMNLMDNPSGCPQVSPTGLQPNSQAPQALIYQVLDEEQRLYSCYRKQ